jgi:uncharacterized protein with PIN domain
MDSDEAGVARATVVEGETSMHAAHLDEHTTTAQNDGSLASTAELKYEKCPYCGHPLEAILKREEKGTMFIWFACSDDDCDGKVLSAYPLA